MTGIWLAVVIVGTAVVAGSFGALLMAVVSAGARRRCGEDLDHLFLSRSVR